MGAVASVTITVDSNGAISSVNNFTGAIEKMPAAFQKSGSSSNVIFTQMSKDHERARQSAQLLANQLGIQLPRALEQVLSKTPGVSQALNAAFAASVIVAFAKEVIALVDNLTGYSEQLAKIQQQNDALIQSVSAANKTLLGPQTLKQIQVEILNTNKYIDQLNEKLGLTGGAWDPLWRGLTKYNQEQRATLEDLDKAKGHLNDLATEQAKLTDEQKRTDPLEVMKLENQARAAGLLGIQAITAAERAQVAETIAGGKATAENELVTQAKIVAIHADSAAKRIAYGRQEDDETRKIAEQAVLTNLQGTAAIDAQERDQIAEQQVLLDRKLISIKTFNERRTAIEYSAASQRKEIERQATEDTLKLEEEAAVATVPPWQRAYAQIEADTQDKLRQIQKNLDDFRISSDQAAEQTAAVWQTAFAHTRDQLAGDLESLFDDVTSGNIGKRFKKMFEDLVFQMVATWILGMQQMRGAASTGFGGGGGGILGALFGGLSGGGSGSGGTPPFLGGLFGGGGGSTGDISSTAGGISLLSGLGLAGLGASESGGSSILGLGLSAGLGGNTPGAVLPSGAGGLAAGGGGFLAKLLGSGGFQQLALTGGIGLLLNGFGKGGAGGILSSAAGGALIGSIIPGVGTILGAVIGGIVGLVSSLFGEHKGDKARKQVMEPLIAQIKVIKDSFDVFQTDYNTGVGELEQLRSQSIAALKQIGGNQVKGNTAGTNKMVDDAEAYLKSTEAERERRAQIQFGPAQFDKGGFVSPSLARGVPYGFEPAMAFATGGAVPAIVHAGEFVLNRRAVNRIGVDNLNAMNAGGSGGDMHLHLHVMDAKTSLGWLRGGGTKQIAKELDRLKIEGAN